MNPPSQEQRFVGSEMVSFPTVSSSDPMGTLLFDFDVNPKTFVGSRLATVADLWDMWKINSFSVELTPSVPMTVPGSYVLGIDPDPKADYGGMGSVNRIKALSNIPGGGVFQLFQPARVFLQSNRSKEWLFCNPSQEEAYKTMAGVVACALVAPPSGTTGGLLLTLKIHYDIQFRGQSLQEPSVEGLTKLVFTTGPNSSYPEFLAKVDNAIAPANDGQIYTVKGTSVTEHLPTALETQVLTTYTYVRLLNLAGSGNINAKFYDDYENAVIGAGSNALQRSALPGVSIVSPGVLFVELIEP